jgi:hypothetical protein
MIHSVEDEKDYGKMRRDLLDGTDLSKMAFVCSKLSF